MLKINLTWSRIWWTLMMRLTRVLVSLLMLSGTMLILWLPVVAVSIITLSLFLIWSGRASLHLVLIYKLVLIVFSLQIITTILWLLTLFICITFFFSEIFIFLRTLILWIYIRSSFLTTSALLTTISVLRRRATGLKLIAIIKLVVHSLINDASNVQSRERIVMSVHCQSFYNKILNPIVVS